MLYTRNDNDGAKRLRHTETDATIDIRFECGQVGSIERAEMPLMSQLRLETITGQVVKTVSGMVTVPHGVSALCFNTQGTLLTRIAPTGQVMIIPPRSVTYMRGGTTMLVQAARGEHVVEAFSWSQSLTPLLDQWALGRATSKNGMRQVACRPIDPNLVDAYDRFEAARTGPREIAEPMLLSAAYQLIGDLMMTSDEVQVAPTPGDISDVLKDLITQVRATPSMGWPLRDAANAAGYSPFHFSRVFKQQVGYGFHEFVDRCRTEAAVQQLLNTETNVDLIASSSGFGTTQALRESIKEYLGLVPSELRSVPEVAVVGNS